MTPTAEHAHFVLLRTWHCCTQACKCSIQNIIHVQCEATTKAIRAGNAKTCNCQQHTYRRVISTPTARRHKQLVPVHSAPILFHARQATRARKHTLHTAGPSSRGHSRVDADSETVPVTRQHSLASQASLFLSRRAFASSGLIYVFKSHTRRVYGAAYGQKSLHGQMAQASRSWKIDGSCIYFGI